MRTRTKFARYTVRARCLQSRCVQKHSLRDEHRRAQALYFHPASSQTLFVATKTGDLAIVAGSIPSWDDIERASELFRDPAHDPDDVAKAGRVKFPGMLHVYASTLDEIERDVFPGSLQILVGHPLVYGWRLAMQAALTVTMHVDVDQSAELLAAKSMLAMDKLGTAAAVLDESWPSFALKVALATRSTNRHAGKLDLCVDAGIRYQHTT